MYVHSLKNFLNQIITFELPSLLRFNLKNDFPGRTPSRIASQFLLHCFEIPNRMFLVSVITGFVFFVKPDVYT